MLAELGRQAEFIRTDYPKLRKTFERFLVGGRLTDDGRLFKKSLRWERTEALTTDKGTFKLEVTTGPAKYLVRADFHIKVSTVDGAQVQIELPSPETLMRYGAEDYTDLPEKLSELVQVVEKFLTPRIRQMPKSGGGIISG